MIDIILWSLVLFNTAMWGLMFYYKPIPVLRDLIKKAGYQISTNTNKIENLQKFKQDIPTRDYPVGGKHEFGHNYE